MLAIGKVETVKNEKVIMGVVWLKCYLKVTKIKNLFISKSGCVPFLIILIITGVAEPGPEKFALISNMKSDSFIFRIEILAFFQRIHLIMQVFCV